jgi:hypothetical protein
MGDAVTLSVSLNTTPDGFMSQECLRASALQGGSWQGQSRAGDPLPLLQLRGQRLLVDQGASRVRGCVWSATDHRPQLDEMVRGFNRGSRKNDFLTITASVKTPPKAVAPPEDDDMPASITFACCGETIRHDGKEAKLHCPICGSAQ